MDLHAHIAQGIEYLERPGTGGPTIMLLHGIGSQAQSFETAIRQLPEDWRVIAWNAPGYGRSEPLAQPCPVALDYAEALQRLIQDLRLTKLVVAGHSLGSLVGAAYAATHRDRVSQLLLASPALGHGMAPGTLSTAAQARIDDLHTQGPEAFAAARANRLVFRAEQAPELVARVQQAMSQVTSPGYDAAVRMLASGRLLDDAVRLLVPTDVIVGAEDVVTPPDGARRVHATLHAAARGRLTLVPGCGHALYQQCPAAFAGALTEMMETAR
ncbi:alpha/beta fold hydrolase [Nioella nitratireducens]|uniref:alpha/beta fold hydrolase n=1 Tax=Nioella nitratireducens TaxID=1287720 RepID=UPI0008FD78EC|nr:alpha/beta hydrolase [Nioella nitratireducens]